MKHVLKLYVIAQTPLSVRAIRNLEQICANELEGKYGIEVIDILEHPQLAEEDKIVATPTLMKALPAPVRTIIGDLSDHQKVLMGLDLVTTKEVIA